MLKKLLLLSLNFVLVLMACKGDKINDNTYLSKDKTTTAINQGKDLGYDFDSPQIIVLDRQLMEISGLAYHPSKDVLLAHNDEKGHVYEISKSEGKILEDYKFDKKDDYESVEFHEGQYIICSSSGNLHLYNPENKETEKIKTKMSSKNDIEGMCLDPTKTQLLLACKGQGISDSKKKDIKAVYAFDKR